MPLGPHLCLTSGGGVCVHSLFGSVHQGCFDDKHISNRRTLQCGVCSDFSVVLNVAEI